jgi:hypothetical protein
MVVPRAQMIWSTAKNRAAAVRWSKFTTCASTFEWRVVVERATAQNDHPVERVIVRQQAQAFIANEPGGAEQQDGTGSSHDERTRG